jgi:type II secretory pathway pseudopilin PulG
VCARFAVSLLETTIALGILGVGLIMVAAVFPVALSQHRDATDQARATELITKAQAMLQSRINQDSLWVSNTLPLGQDSPWYLLPTTNLYYAVDVWDRMPALAPPGYTQQSSYANVINGLTETEVSSQNLTVLTGLDALSDRVAPFTAVTVPADPPSPFTDSQFADAPSRLTWYGFYRRIAGKFAFSVAVCRQQRSQCFVEQDLSATAVDPSLAAQARNPYSTPIGVYSGVADCRRLPVVWRVSVGRGAGRVLFNTATAPMLGAGVPLGRLAPPGSKIMIQGSVHQEPDPGLPTVGAPAGRVLTVSDVLSDAAGAPSVVEVVEDISDLPLYGPVSGSVVTFDVWLLPPPVTGGEFERHSPLIEWKSLL